MSSTNYWFGVRKEDGVRIYLSKPTWDCGWYWGFGYLGNSREHYHLSAYQSLNRMIQQPDGKFIYVTEQRNLCMYDALKQDYDLNPKLGARLWEFCELALTAYTLKDAAEVLGRGGSHMTSNPCAELIKNKEEVARINEVVLPAIFARIDNIFTAEEADGTGG